MFSIIITEKGGAERREQFEKEELTVGRVQGNDIVLPKGNVSKQHARFVAKDGRFIVSDLKSTNGTYVNGRKIAQATVVRDGDKVYVGDFVLRFEALQAQAPIGFAEEDDGALENEAVTVSKENPVPAGPPVGVGIPLPHVPPAPVAHAGPPPLGAVPPPLAGFGAPAPAQAAMVPTAPPFAPVGSGPRPLGRTQAQFGVAPPQVQPSPIGAPPASAGDAPTPYVEPQRRVPPKGLETRPSRPPSSAVGGQSAVGTSPPPAVAPVSPSSQPSRQPIVAPDPMGAFGAARKLALLAVVNRVANAIDLGSIGVLVAENVRAKVERAVREQTGQMNASGDLPSGVDAETVAADVLADILHLGPIGALLEDDAVTEIFLPRFDQIFVARGGELAAIDLTFSNAVSAERAVMRLAEQSGAPIGATDHLVERATGTHQICLVRSALTHGFAGSIRRVTALNADLVRGPDVSRAITTYLEAAMTVRANILVIGPDTDAAGALCSLANSKERQVIIGSSGHQGAPSKAILLESASSSVSASVRMCASHTFVLGADGGTLATSVEAILGGASGFVVGQGAISIRQGLARLCTHIGLLRPGIAAEFARDAVAEAFDVAIEVGVVQGNLRILRVAELAGVDNQGIVARDIFASPPEGGEIQPTGAVPRLASEFANRGVKFDMALFKRR